MTTRIIKKTVKGVPGFSIVGTDSRGKSIRIFVRQRFTAINIKRAINAGEPEWAIGRFIATERSPGSSARSLGSRRRKI